MTSSDLTDLGSLGRLGASLERAADTGRLSPSYLFEGTDEVLLREAALSFAARILASGATGDARARIVQRVRDGTHPDLHVQERDKATVISVAALTVVLEEAHAAPVSGAHQVFVVDPAEAMEPEGIARYLKALEEPPASTVFLLVSTRPERLPETVLSRVQRIRIPPATSESIADRLAGEGVEAEEAQRIARWCGGSLARARRLASAGTPEIVRTLVGAAVEPTPGTAAAVDSALAAIGKEATTLAETSGEAKADRKREAVRVLLADVLYVLCADARDRVAGRPSAYLAALDANAAARVLERLGALAATVSANVTPAVVLLEAVRHLRRELGPA